ncbi:AraC family transcriptional regulator [Chachezhania sediminis]|uniref:AraC family transcriptional regulator n=1 Tax=Chachezhania sediminis TaxID=2599291 RepID=UPI00131E9F9B|nr:AraC family transcriptional regulator [Chachezhania sediminis]
MPGNTPQHGAMLIQGFTKDLIEQGYTERQVFHGSGVSPRIMVEEKPSLPFEQIASFFEHAAELTGNDLVGFERGTERTVRRAGLICYVGTSSPNLMDALKNVARFQRVYSDAVDFDTSELQTKGLVNWQFRVETRVQRRQYVEFSASGMLTVLRLATGRHIVPEYVHFSHARNTNIDVMQDFFGCPVAFAKPQNQVKFRMADLELSLPAADDDLHAVLKDYCEDVLGRKSRNVPPIIIDVEKAIVDRLASGEATQEEVGRALGMSARTLARRLSEEGTTFFKTVEELRHTLAVNYLKDSDLVLAEIAYLLGYSGMSSFNDAFKRWTGHTPGQFRKRKHHDH